MNRFLFGALAMGAVFVLTSFAFRSPSDSVAKRAGAPAWKVSEYQLDRAFRVQLTVSPGSPQSAPMPATGGLIITEVRAAGYCSYGGVSIAVNGVGEDFPLSAGTQQVPFIYNLNPPIIARPGDLLTLSTSGQLGVCVVVSGYTTMPGET